MACHTGATLALVCRSRGPGWRLAGMCFKLQTGFHYTHQSSLSPAYHPDMTEILIKRRG